MKKSILTLILSVVALGAFGSTMPMLCPEPTYHDISLTEYVPYSVVNIACPDATASVLNELPKDIVICDWYYRKPRATYPSLEHFKSLGFDVVTCPWENRQGAIAEIKAAHKIGIKGVLGTLWHHYYGESLINSYFYVSSLSWNSNASLAAFGSQRNNRYVFHTHLRHIGWDMKNRRARNTGIYCNEVPIDSHMH